MEESNHLPRFIQFAEFRFDTQVGELRKGDLVLRVPQQPLQILCLLLEHAGELVSREELRTLLWPDGTFLDFEDGINHAVRRLRDALGDTSEHPRFIETVPRRGYRFIAPVEAQQPLTPAISGLGQALPESAQRPTEAEEGAVAAVSDRRQDVTAVPDRRTAMRTSPLQRPWAIALAGLLAAAAAGFSIAWFLTHWALPPQPTERRLTANSSENALTQGAISPDGKYLAYGDEMGMHLKLVKTGEALNIPQPEGPAPQLDSWWPNGWFPDGTKFVAERVVTGGHLSAWVVSVMGGPPRKLRDDADAWFVSPDGTLIAFGTGAGFIRSREIWLMGAQGEEPRRFVSGSEDDAFFWAAWSPGSRRIAYTRYHRTPGGLQCSIESRDLEGGQPTVILSDPRLCFGDTYYLWYPGGRFIFTMLEPEPRQNDDNLWEMRVDTRTGRALSKPRRLTDWVGVYTWHLTGTQDGKQLAVSKTTPQAGVYIGELEAKGPRLTSTRRLTLDDYNDNPGHWMPDGRGVLFVSDRNGTWDIFKQALDRAEAQPVVTGADHKQHPILSPDGSWILYLSSATSGVGAITPVSIMRVPTSGGAPELVLREPGIDNLACAQPPATNCVFSQVSPDYRQLIFSAFDPTDGRRQQVTGVNFWQGGGLPKAVYDWDLSPDGSRLAFLDYDPRTGRIQILPVRGGEARDVIVEGRSGLRSLRWAADGKGLLVATAGGDALLHVDLQGRAEVLWQRRPPDVYYLWGAPSPDGRHLALCGFARNNNVWLLENF